MSERLWAPWRMDFIRQSDTPTGCVPCGYVDREVGRASPVLVRQPHAFDVLDKFPYTAGHLLVVPVRHTQSLAELAPEEHAQGGGEA